MLFFCLALKLPIAFLTVTVLRGGGGLPVRNTARNTGLAFFICDYKKNMTLL